MYINDLVSTNESAILQVAELLVEGFATNWPNAWPDYKFFQTHGLVVVAVMPGANGPGKPNMLIAKLVMRSSQLRRNEWNQHL